MMMYLSARLSWVPWWTPQTWGALDACTTADTLYALSPWRPRFSRFTLRQQKATEKETDSDKLCLEGKHTMKGHSFLIFSNYSALLLLLNNCFQIEPLFPLSTHVLKHNFK